MINEMVFAIFTIVWMTIIAIISYRFSQKSYEEGKKMGKAFAVFDTLDKLDDIEERLSAKKKDKNLEPGINIALEIIHDEFYKR